MREIVNRNLRLSNIPNPDANLGEISEFALTFDGYNVWGSFEKCAEIANSRNHGSLTNLRTCLFFEQRRWHHFGKYPNDDSMAYIRSLIEKIRNMVASGDLM